MELFNTHVVDPTSATHQKDFKSLIHDNEHIIFVAIGDTEACKKMIARADEFADDSVQRITRKVAWIPKHDVLKEHSLAYLKTFEEFVEDDYEKVMAYVLSPKWHETKFVIKKGDTVDDLLLNKAYWMASLRERAEI